MRLFSDSRDAEYLAQKVENTGGVYFVPAFTGLGAPYWDMYARGCIVGLTRGTKPEHIIRAAQESIAYQSADLLTAMEKDIGLTVESINVDGGASRDRFLMQFQADILGKRLMRPKNRETTALGAALLAGLAVGVWKDIDEIKFMRELDTEFTPEMDSGTRQDLLAGWHKAVSRSMDWAV
jgi:glycerol kinase